MLKTEYIEAIRAHLDEYFLHFEDERARLTVLLEQVRERDILLCDRKHLPGHLTASALVLHPSSISVLLIEHKTLKRWLQPGGHLEPDELPVDGARRELREEVGSLSVTLLPWHEQKGICLDVDSHWIPANARKNEAEHLHHDFQYIFTCEHQAATQLDLREVSDSAWLPMTALLQGEYGSRLARVAGKLQSLLLI